MSCNVVVFVCSYRWSFGVLTWEIVTFGKSLVFFYSLEVGFGFFIFVFNLYAKVCVKTRH